MIVLSNTTAQPNQTARAVLADGTTISFTFVYRAAVQRWAVDVSYQNFSVKGKGLSTHPNLLRLYRNVIPFGLTVATADGTDPFLANDLAYVPGGIPPRVILTVLDQTAGLTDVTDVENSFFAAGAPAAY